MLANGIKETTTTTGTGTVTTSAVTGLARIGEALQTNQLCKYSLLDSTGALLEWGIGTYLGSNQLARTIVLGTYSTGAFNTSTATAVSLTGTTTVIVTEIMGGSIPGLTSSSTTNGSSGAHVPEPVLLSASAGSVTVTADRLYLQPVRIATPRKITAMKIRVSTGGTGNARIGLYKCDENGNAKELLLSSGDIALAASGVVAWTLTTAQIFLPDWYVLGFATKGTAPTINTSGGTHYFGATPFNTDSTVVQPVAHKYAALTGGWTTLPDPAPTSLTSSAVQPPLIALVTG